VSHKPTKSYYPPAQIGLVAIPLAGFLVKDLISKFQEVAHRMMFEAQNTGDALLTKFGNELEVATKNLDYVLSKQQATLFDNLSVQQQGAFIELNNLINALNNATDHASTIAELTNLDLIEFTNRLKLITNKIDFYISSINGQTFVFQDSDYRLMFTGIGFGFDDSTHTYRVRVTIGGQVIPDTSITRPSTHQLQVNIPNTLVKAFFKDTKIEYVPVSFETNIMTKSGSSWKTDTYNVNFNLTLLPILAGEIKITEPVREQILDGKTKTYDIVVTTSGCKSDHPCDWDREHSVAQNERIIGVRYDCSGQCDWSYSLRMREANAKAAQVRPGCEAAAGPKPGGFAKIIWETLVNNCVNGQTQGMNYLPDYDILDGSTKAHVYRHVDGENSTTVIYHVDYQTLVDKVSYKVRDPMHIPFSQQFDINFDPGNAPCEFEITGKAVTGQKININNSTAGNSGSLLRALGIGKFGDHCRGTFILQTP
jgi:hypothetical protein